MDEQLMVFIKRGQLMVSILIAALVIFLLGQLGLQSRQLEQQNANQITVSGQGKIFVKPDIAVIDLGVTTSASTVADVTAKNTTQMNSVIDAIKKLGVAEKDIQTTNYNLSPVYSESYIVPTPVPLIYSNGAATTSGVVGGQIVRPGAPTLTGYKLEQDVEVKIRDFTKIGNVLSQAATQGSNVIGDLQFSIDNPEQFQNQARAKAIADAKINANNLAKESGISLGKLINVYEGYNPSPVMYNSAKAMSVGASDSAIAVPTVQPGQEEIDVSVNLTYQLQ